MHKSLLLGAVVLALAGCSEQASIPIRQGMGPRPTLPPPDPRLIPTVNVAKATGWPAGTQPHAAAGLAVTALASGLDHPRWLYVLPNGDVLVAETNAPPKPEDGKGIKGWFMQRAMKKAGAGVPSANRITLLRDADGDGKAETRSAFLSGINSPFGMALVGNDLYVAASDALLRFPYRDGDTVITALAQKVIDLPAGALNHHWTKNVIAEADGKHLYVSVGSNSNVGENGMQAEHERAAILEVDPAAQRYRVYASGLRNPVGMALEPASGMLWTVVNERDEIGSDLVPDYLTSVQDGAFYGWPYSYYGAHVDVRVQPPRPDLVASAVVPDYALGAHTASLGLAWSGTNTLPPRFAQGMFIGQHGSWNRRPPSGYKLIFVPFSNGKPAGEALDVLDGFLDEQGRARGRPVGVAVDRRGNLLLADDVGNVVWRVSAAQ